MNVFSKAWHKIRKVIYVPVVIAAETLAWDFTISRFNATAYPDDVRMKSHGWGWADPALDPAWDRLFNNPNKEGWFHRVKNVGSEWCRLDSERAGKATSWLISLAFLLGLAAGFYAGVHRDSIPDLSTLQSSAVNSVSGASNVGGVVVNRASAAWHALID